jgi:hypothetical protein
MLARKLVIFGALSTLSVALCLSCFGGSATPTARILGTMATQNQDDVTILGGYISGVSTLSTVSRLTSEASNNARADFFMSQDETYLAVRAVTTGATMIPLYFQQEKSGGDVTTVGHFGVDGLFTASYGLKVLNNSASHSYAAGTTAWTMTAAEAAASLFTVTNAGGAANAVFPAAFAGKQFTVYNNSGQTITFKVTGQTGAATTNAKYSTWTMSATDCVKIYEQP